MTLEELYKKRDEIEEQIEELKNQKKNDDLKQMQLKFLGNFVRQYRGGSYNDLTFMKVKSVGINDDEEYGETCYLQGNSIYIELPYFRVSIGENDEIEDASEVTIVTEEEMLKEIQEVLMKNFNELKFDIDV